MSHLHPTFNRPSPARRRPFLWLVLGGFLLGVVCAALALVGDSKNDHETTRKEKAMATAVSSLESISERRSVPGKGPIAFDTATFGMG
jgi:hypothetical protein